MNELTKLGKKYEIINLQPEKHLSEYTSDALSITSNTVISKGALYNIHPYEIEQASFKKGKQLKKMPTHLNNSHVYHFDERERIIFIETYGRTDNLVDKEFITYGSEHLERIYFTSVKDLRNISKAFFENGLIKRVINWGGAGCSVSDYVYTGSLLEKIFVRQKEHGQPSFSEFDIIFKYNNNELESITNVFPNGYCRQCFP